MITPLPILTTPTIEERVDGRERRGEERRGGSWQEGRELVERAAGDWVGEDCRGPELAGRSSTTRKRGGAESAEQITLGEGFRWVGRCDVCPFNSSEVQNFGFVTQVSSLLFGAGGDGFQC
jgi:hypothetical protein